VMQGPTRRMRLRITHGGVAIGVWLPAASERAGGREGERAREAERRQQRGGERRQEGGVIWWWQPS